MLLVLKPCLGILRGAQRLASARPGWNRQIWKFMGVACTSLYYLSKDLVNGETGCWSFEQAIAFAIVAYVLSTEWDYRLLCVINILLAW